MAMHGNAWHCSIAEDASGKDLYFHVVTVLYQSTTSGQARCTTEENNQLFITIIDTSGGDAGTVRGG